MPRYAVFFMFMMLASIGLPGTSGFVGMLVLIGAWQATVGLRSSPQRVWCWGQLTVVAIAGSCLGQE